MHCLSVWVHTVVCENVLFVGVGTVVCMNALFVSVGTVVCVNALFVSVGTVVCVHELFFSVSKVIYTKTVCVSLVYYRFVATVANKRAVFFSFFTVATVGYIYKHSVCQLHVYNIMWILWLQCVHKNSVSLCIVATVVYVQTQSLSIDTRYYVT